MLTGFLQGNWTLLLLSQGLLFIVFIYCLLKNDGLASASFSCVCHYHNFEWPRHGSRDNNEEWDEGCLKQTNRCALKLSTALLLLSLELKIYMGIFVDEKQSRNCMKGIHTLQLTKGPSTGTCTRQLMFRVENTLLFYHIWVSAKCRSLRLFCGAHLDLFWENNDTYWVTNVPHN